jgi:hypothetical protein
MGPPRSFDDIPPVMNSAQVAELLLIGRVDSVQRTARDGRLPAHRDSGAHAWWFARDELIAWVRDHRVVPDD